MDPVREHLLGQGYIGHTLFSGIGSWANEPQLVGEPSDLGDTLPPSGIRAAMADISPV